MERDGITQRVREAAKLLGTFDLKQMEDRGVTVQTFQDRRRLAQTIKDLVRTGELERLDATDQWRYVGKTGGPQAQEVMWRLVRARRTVTVDDLQELSGATRNYCLEFLRRLVRRGVVKKHANGNWQLVDDPVDMPGDDAKKERLRLNRKRKQAAIEALDRAWIAIAEARMAVVELSEGG